MNAKHLFEPQRTQRAQRNAKICEQKSLRFFALFAVESPACSGVIRVHPRSSVAVRQEGKFSRRGAEAQRNSISSSVFISVYQCSSVAQKAFATGATL